MLKKIFGFLLIISTLFIPCSAQRTSVDTLNIPFAYDTTAFNKLKIDLKGLDVSMWQGKIDWCHIDSLGYDFVFIKATQGLRTDPNFFYNWNNCNTIKGAYHFFMPNISGIAQAKHFLNTVKLKKGDLPPVIDVEFIKVWKSTSKWLASKNLKEMLTYIETHTGVKPIIYTNNFFWNTRVYPFYKGPVDQYPLWIAHYTDNLKPYIPFGWNNWTFWQWTHKGTVQRCRGYWDHNYYNGTDLKKLLIK
jgi:lysozyme